MFSKVADLTRFLKMFLNGGELDGVRVFSRAAVKAMTTDQTNQMTGIPSSQKFAMRCGLGWRLAPLPAGDSLETFSHLEASDMEEQLAQSFGQIQIET